MRYWCRPELSVILRKKSQLLYNLSPNTGFPALDARATEPLRNCIGKCNRILQDASSCVAFGKHKCRKLYPYVHPRDARAIAIAIVTS
jgi:hypothetical protein